MPLGLFPRSIHRNIIIEQVGPEILIYDESRHQAFCLNAMSAAVWSCCDGERSVEQIAAEVTNQLAMPLTQELVTFTLGELRKDGLLEPEFKVDLAVALSRREMAWKLGISAAMLLPVIATIVAPKAAQAYDGCADC